MFTGCLTGILEALHMLTLELELQPAEAAGGSQSATLFHSSPRRGTSVGADQSSLFPRLLSDTGSLVTCIFTARWRGSLASRALHCASSTGFRDVLGKPAAFCPGQQRSQ